MVIALERCFKEVLGADICNWSCLLNSFYKEEAPNSHLHLHVCPRKRAPVVLEDKAYTDEEFGHHYLLRKESQIGETEFHILFDMLQHRLRQREG